jgi:dienelactone hydrolase
MRLPVSLIAFLITCYATQAVAAPTVAQAQAPAGAEDFGVTWRVVRSPNGSILLAEARPAGSGPFPAVVLLHGTHGFAREYVQLANEFTKAGLVAIATCWFAPGQGEGTRFITPLKCPASAPPISPHQSKQAMESIDSIMSAVRSLPEVDGKRVALFGHSRGAGVVWNYVLRGGKVRAAILNSSGYPDELIQNARKFAVPALLLHGEKDGPADGGSPMTDIRRARSFENALRDAGKSVDAAFYPAGGHNSLFADHAQHEDELKRMTKFLQRHLGLAVRR